jgi:hypothetical protein
MSPDFKWSGLDLFVRLSNGKNKMEAKLVAVLFLPSESRTGHFLTSLDCFGMNKIFFL